MFMSRDLFFVGLDVGGSSMKAGVVNDHGQPISAAARQGHASVSLPTEANRGQEFGLERMCETIRAAIAAAGLRPDQQPLVVRGIDAEREHRIGQSLGQRAEQVPGVG